jgi:hypothetical protein
MKKIFAGLLILCFLAIASYVSADSDKSCVCTNQPAAMKEPVMRGFYWQTAECQKFYDETRDLRKQLHDMEFEYFEASRNPKTLGGSLQKIESDLQELNKKINAQAPIGCWW